MHWYYTFCAHIAFHCLLVISYVTFCVKANGKQLDSDIEQIYKVWGEYMEKLNLLSYEEMFRGTLTHHLVIQVNSILNKYLQNVSTFCQDGFKK